MSPEELIQRALEARERAYAPYSGFLVGSALITRSGQVYVGCNVENASYGLTICAERCAIVASVSSGDREIVALAVVAPGGASMCGACRQVLREFGADITVHLGDDHGSFRTTRIADLLPEAFGRAQPGSVEE